MVPCMYARDTYNDVCFLMPLGQASRVAFFSPLSCRKNRYIFVNGDVETARFERKKVWFSCLVHCFLFYMI